MAKLDCGDCVHRLMCKYKEEYAIFLEETMNEPFDLSPEFLEIYIRCKYFHADLPTPRTLKERQVQHHERAQTPAT